MLVHKMKDTTKFVIVLSTLVDCLFFSCNSRNSLAANCSNDEKYEGVESVDIKNGPGNVIVRPSSDEDTTVELAGEESNEVQIIQEEKNLSITRNNNPEGKLFSVAKPVDITVYVAPTVSRCNCKMGFGSFDVEHFKGNLFLKSGQVNVVLRDITGNVSLDTGPHSFDIAGVEGNISLEGGVGKGSFVNVNGDISLKTSGSNISFLNIFGNISLRCPIGTFNYTMMTKPILPIFFKVKGSRIVLNVNLSSDFETILCDIKKCRLSSFLPVVTDLGDINFSGQAPGVNINVKKID